MNIFGFHTVPKGTVPKGEFEGEVVIIMEYANEGSLLTYLQKWNQVIPIKLLKKIITDCLKGLQFGIYNLINYF